MEENKKFVSSSGTPFYCPIDYEYDEKVKCFVPVFKKKQNRYEMIQASKPTCDINYIVKRALAGDYTALNVKIPNYADVSDIPDNLNDIHNLNINAINQFYSLDVNLRNAFNNDVDIFAAAVENGTVNDVISNYVKSLNNVVDNKKEDGGTE